MRILVVVTMLLLSGRVLSADDSLRELIAALEQEESHYANLQLELQSVYLLAEDAEVDFIPNAQQTLQSDERISFTVQGDQFRSHETRVSHSLLEDSTSEVIQCFDGQTHRYFWQDHSNKADTDEEVRFGGGGMISDERPSVTNLVRPHMFLLESGAPRVPLSTYLSGTEAVLAHPNPGGSVGSAIEILDLGSDEFDGMKCRRIRIETYSGESRHSAWELWLAEERNLIPIRKLGYNYLESIIIPAGESTVKEWQEIRPGIWFPMQSHLERYDPDGVRDGLRHVRWREEYTVQNVSLEPETSTTTFKELEFPLGTRVRVIENGEVVEDGEVSS